MKNETRILLPDFLSFNGHGLVHTAKEGFDWEQILDTTDTIIKTTAQTNHPKYIVRGSCILQTALLLQKEIIDTQVSYPPLVREVEQVIAPYAFVGEILTKELANEGWPDDAIFLLNLATAPTLQLNIDVYHKVNSMTLAHQTAQEVITQLNDSCNCDLQHTKTPTGINIINIQHKNRFYGHNQGINFIVKPPVKNETDRRASMSQRQSASTGNLNKDGNCWGVDISQANIETCISEDKATFLKNNLPFPLLFEQIVRMIRVNVRYPVIKDGDIKTELSSAALEQLAKTLTISWKKNKSKEFPFAIAKTIMYELFIAFLHDHQKVINFINLCPKGMFPFFDRTKAKHLIPELNRISSNFYGTEDRVIDTDISHIAQLITVTDKNGQSVVKNKSKKLFNYLNRRRYTQTLYNYDNIAYNWYFKEPLEFYHLLLTFWPLPKYN